MRIALAIAVSLLLHGALIVALPMTAPAPATLTLPPLLAQLEPLPARIAPAPPKLKNPKPRPKPKVLPPPAAPSPDIPPAVEPAAEPPVSPAMDEAGDSAAVGDVAAIPSEAPPPPPAHPLPKQAQLKFTVYKGTGFAIGEAIHRLEVSEDQHYVLSVNVNTTGLVGMLKKFNLTQTSSGRYQADGLQPEKFSEVKTTSNGVEQVQVEFSWSTKMLNFSSGLSLPLPSQSQDFVSFLYQLSQLPLEQNSLPIFISNGKKLERYELAIGDEQEIDTPLGKIRALPFRKIHAVHEEGLEVWLGLEYRLLPVKIIQFDRDGGVLGQMVISDIRVSTD
ncbi:MAG: DUF3108 domain-containing protein [Gallionella sp.]